MSNIFDSTEWPTTPPDPFIAGDYFAFKRGDLTSAFPIASYAVTFNASLFGSSTSTTSAAQIPISATESGSEYLFTVNGNSTKDWTTGDYAWSIFVTDSSDANKRHQIQHGTFEVKANWAVSTADPRSDAQKNLELIEDILYNRVQGDVSSYSIAGRSLSKMGPDELITMRDFYKRQVTMETRKERIRLGFGTGANILPDFRR